MLKKVTLFFTVIVLSISSAFGSGFSIYEQGAKAVAMGGAFIAQANDASAVFYNPAGITALNKFNISFGTTIIATNFAFQGPSNVDPKGYTKAEKGLFYPSTLYATYQLHNRINIGFGFFTLFGLGSEWGTEEEPWVGRQLATKSELQTFFYNPVLAFKIFDNLSVAAGLEVVQGKVNLEKSIYFTPRGVFGESALEANATGYGYNLGIKYKPFECLSLGLVYRSNVLLEFKDGDATFTFPATGDSVIDGEIASFFPEKTKGSADIELPDLIGIGIAYSFTENLTAEFDYLHIGWSSYDELTIEFEDQVAGKKETTSEKNYEDSYSLRFGLEYKLNEMWALRLGYLWDKHAVPGAYVEPSLPEGDRHNYTIGFGFNWSGLTIDGTYYILLQDDRGITDSVENFNGEYSGMANLFGLSIGYSF